MRGISYAVNTGRGVSPSLWQFFPHQEVQLGFRPGIFFFDDFLNAPLLASATSQNGYISYQDTGVTIKGTSEAGGVLEFAGADADNDEGSLQYGANLAGFLSLPGDKSGGLTIIEMRAKLSVLTDLGVFLGMAEPGFAVTNALVDNTGALADKDAWGFHSATATPTTLNAVHRKSGGAMVTVGAAHTWDTDYVKLGMVYDPSGRINESPNRTVAWFVNGVRVAGLTDLSVATWPNDQVLTPTFAYKTGEAVEKKMYIDWLCVGHVFPNAA